MLSETGSDHSVEFRLLLACSKLPTDEALVRNLASQVQDWEKFLSYAECHEMTPLICHSLIDSALFTLFRYVSSISRRKSARTHRRICLLTAELLRIMRALLAENIRAIPYKGPVLAASAYGTLAARGFCDLDILVAETDVRRTLGIMSELGYRAEYNLTPAQEAKYFRNTCEYNFLHESKHTQVEIHWQIVPAKLGLTFDFDRLWSRTRFLPIGNSQLPILSPEDTLLVLSVHGFKHLWTSLKWVCDIAAVISSPEELDWTYVRIGIRSHWSHADCSHRLVPGKPNVPEPSARPHSAQIESRSGRLVNRWGNCSQLFARRPNVTYEIATADAQGLLGSSSSCNIPGPDSA